MDGIYFSFQNCCFFKTGKTINMIFFPVGKDPLNTRILYDIKTYKDRVYAKIKNDVQTVYWVG